MKPFVVDAWLPDPPTGTCLEADVQLVTLLREFGDVTFAVQMFASRRSGLNAL